MITSSKEFIESREETRKRNPMEDLQRTLGRVEEQLEWLCDSVKTLQTKVDDLSAFKWKVIGASLSASAIFNALIEVIKK